MEGYSAWNPGISSSVPLSYTHLFTHFNPDNVLTSYDDAKEAAVFSGLPELDVIAFRPERLLLHETFIRFMARVHYMERGSYYDLGNQFRNAVQQFKEQFLAPELDRLVQAYDDLRSQISQDVSRILSETIFKKEKPPEAKKTGGLRSLFSFLNERKLEKPAKSSEEKNNDYINDFLKLSKEAASEKDRYIYRTLHNLFKSLTLQNLGKVPQNPEFCALIATNMICNEYGSKVLGDEIETLVYEAIKEFDLQPVDFHDFDQAKIISLKGASAAGKSSFRFDLGTDPKYYLHQSDIKSLDGFASISPDICRKMLIDYDALGEAYKYAGTFTSLELQIIDKKIDRYLSGVVKEAGKSPNLLIDRFRFDTFQSELPDFVQRPKNMYMCFIVTEPADLVQRGWNRGLETGRYRSVADFLALSIEAYEGMGDKLSQWVNGMVDQDYEYLFLNNNVAKGQKQKIAAQGNREEMNIFDMDTLVNVSRYQNANINATSPEEVYINESEVWAKNNLDFLLQCIKEVKTINFICPETAVTYAKIYKGEALVLDQERFIDVLGQGNNRAVFSNLGFELKSDKLKAYLETSPSV